MLLRVGAALPLPLCGTVLPLQDTYLLAAFCSNPGAGCELPCVMKSHLLPCSMGMAQGEAAICSVSLARWQDWTGLLEVAF